MIKLTEHLPNKKNKINEEISYSNYIDVFDKFYDILETMDTFQIAILEQLMLL